MTIWNRLRNALPAWPWRGPRASPTTPDGAGNPDGSDAHLLKAAESLRRLLDDQHIPVEVRESLDAEYQQVRVMLDRLEHGHVHVAVFGRVSVGKSALLNALMGQELFEVSPLHGATKKAQVASWEEAAGDGDPTLGGVRLIDTPGIDEIAGEAREQLAHEVASRSDLVLFVVDGDITSSEQQALELIAAQGRPLILVLNKSDRYSCSEEATLLAHLRQRSDGLVHPDNVVAAAARPSPRTVIRIDAQGREQESREQPEPRLTDLKERLWLILEAEGKTLAAINASLFAGQLSDQVAVRIAEARRELADRTVQTWCLVKGASVALNPIPVADLLAAAGVDVALVVHLSRIYNAPLSKSEAGRLVLVIATQLAALMGAVWGVNLVSSALKTASAGLSVAVTAGAQGALAWYATYLVGKAAERYLVQGRSWGDGGPKQVVSDILAEVDRGSILSEAREEILARLKLKAS